MEDNNLLGTFHFVGSHQHFVVCFRFGGPRRVGKFVGGHVFVAHINRLCWSHWTWSHEAPQFWRIFLSATFWDRRSQDARLWVIKVVEFVGCWALLRLRWLIVDGVDFTDARHSLDGWPVLTNFVKMFGSIF